jgi:hypothetical protein
MKKKEINLLPDYARFDINKHFLLKRFFIIFIFNIILLILISVNLILEKNFLKNKILEQESKLKRISILVDNFKIFQKKYSELVKKLNYLNKKKELYYISNNPKFSTFLSLMIFEQCITKGIKINDLNYTNGEFIVNGESDSSKSFYNFYSVLEKNQFIKKVNFYYLEQKNKFALFNFKIKVLLKELE